MDGGRNTSKSLVLFSHDLYGISRTSFSHGNVSSPPGLFVFLLRH